MVIFVLYSFKVKWKNISVKEKAFKKYTFSSYIIALEICYKAWFIFIQEKILIFSS